MQNPALNEEEFGPWHPPTDDQKPVYIGFYDSTTWDPHRKDGFVPSPIRTYWDGKQWSWQKGGEPCHFQARSWRGSTKVNGFAQLANKTTLLASQGGTLEIVEVVLRIPGELQYRSIGESQIKILKNRGSQWTKEFPSTEAAIAWIESKQKGKK